MFPTTVTELCPSWFADSAEESLWPTTTCADAALTPVPTDVKGAPLDATAPHPYAAPHAHADIKASAGAAEWGASASSELWNDPLLPPLPAPFETFRAVALDANPDPKLDPKVAAGCCDTAPTTLRPPAIRMSSLLREQLMAAQAAPSAVLHAFAGTRAPLAPPAIRPPKEQRAVSVVQSTPPRPDGTAPLLKRPSHTALMPPPAAEGTPRADACAAPKRSRSEDVVTTSPQVEELMDLHNRLGRVHKELQSNVPLSADAGCILISAAVQMDQWPPEVCLVYKDATVSPELVRAGGRPPRHEDQGIYPLQIHRQVDGSMLVGLRQTPRDMQTKVEASALSHIDALVCALRILNTSGAQDALQVLLLNTRTNRDTIQRELDARGHPAGAYRLMLEGVKLNLTNKLLQMGIHLGQQMRSVASQV